MKPVSIPAAVERIDDRAGDVRILTLKAMAPLAWHAGQYMHIRVGDLEPRAYSMAAAPDSGGLMTFHIRNMGSGLSAHLATELKVGDLITLEGPYGDMTAQTATARPVLMVAGGTGIAPMLALAGEIIRKGMTEEGITLIYGLRSEDDMYCRAELDALLSTGEVTAHILADPHTPDIALRQLGLNLSEHAVYVSGPDPMMLSVLSVLKDHLAHPARIGCDADMDRLQRPLA